MDRMPGCMMDSRIGMGIGMEMEASRNPQSP